MKDRSIPDGDLPVLNRSAKPVNGFVVVVAVDGEYRVKRLRREPDCVWLHPATPRYQPICDPVGEDVHGLGVVKHGICSLHKPR